MSSSVNPNQRSSLNNKVTRMESSNSVPTTSEKCTNPYTLWLADTKMKNYSNCQPQILQLIG